MMDLFRDTLAGQTIRLLTCGHLCSIPVPDAIACTKTPPECDQKFPVDRTGSEPCSSTSEMEKGKDFELVSWYGTDDPEVSC